MRQKMMLTASAILTLAISGGAVQAQDAENRGEMDTYEHQEHSLRGPGMMHEMGRGHGPGMMHGMGHGRAMGAPGMMQGMDTGPLLDIRTFETVDADEDGRITVEEADTFWTGQLQTYDGDGDGTLSLDEFATMHAAHTRPMTVDRFQALDDDGDGKVTEYELTAPSRRMLRMRQRVDDKAAGRGDMRGRRGADMMREQ